MLDLPTGTISPAGDSRARPVSETADQDASSSAGSTGDDERGQRYGPRQQVSEDVRRRSKAELEAEIAALRQELDAYETRRQAVIDRYERLLTEYQNRLDAESESADPSPSRLERVRVRVLRLFGFR